MNNARTKAQHWSPTATLVWNICVNIEQLLCTWQYTTRTSDLFLKGAFFWMDVHFYRPHAFIGTQTTLLKAKWSPQSDIRTSDRNIVAVFDSKGRQSAKFREAMPQSRMRVTRYVLLRSGQAGRHAKANHRQNHSCPARRQNINCMVSPFEYSTWVNINFMLWLGATIKQLHCVTLYVFTAGAGLNTQCESLCSDWLWHSKDISNTSAPHLCFIPMHTTMKGWHAQTNLLQTQRCPPQRQADMKSLWWNEASTLESETRERTSRSNNERIMKKHQCAQSQRFGVCGSAGSNICVRQKAIRFRVRIASESDA